MNRLLMGILMLGLSSCSSMKRVDHLFTTATSVHNKTFTYAHFVDTFEFDVPYKFGRQ